MSEWIAMTALQPKDGEVVMTKVDDVNGPRNEYKLKRMRNLWWFPDDTMYVYYTPTHWKPL